MLEENGEIPGHPGGVGHTPRDPEKEPLAKIIGKLNDLFSGDHLTDADIVSWFNSLATKVSENSGVMDQIKNNTTEQAMLGDYPRAAQEAVIESMTAHNDLATQFLSDEKVSGEVAKILIDALKREIRFGRDEHL